MDDRTLVERQLGRSPRALRRVVRRCPFGLPAVTEQDPYDATGGPFPTTYYLTCPHLVAAVARLEAAGGVQRWSVAAAADARLATSLRRAHDRQRALRRELAGGRAGRDRGASLDLGVGGAARQGGGLKCLHAHAAFALAEPGYELGERVLAELEPLWPASCCTRLPSAPVSVALGTARQEWGEAHRRLEAHRHDADVYRRLLDQVEVVLAELRRRVGQTFTLGELAAAYDDAERWSRAVLADAGAPPGWTRTLTEVQGAAFHLYARGAVDYEP